MKQTLHYLLTDIFQVLVIPFHLIWRIQVRWPQKLVLASTLCLTVLTIMCTITRVAGVRTSSSNASLDTVWQTYWQFITADVALTMTAATAFRTFFVSRHQERAARGQKSKPSWLGGCWQLCKTVLNRRSWRTKSSGFPNSDESRTPRMELPRIEERATMTGIRTFINHQGVDDDD